MTDTADTARVSSAGGRSRRPNLLPTAVLLLGAVAVYSVIAFQALLNGRASAAEVTALIKSWWYVSNTIMPYTATDATGQMPLYFYQLGFWQQAEGVGHIPARLMSIGFGVISAALLFAICKRLTANTLVAAAGVFIFLATPSTILFFATATPTATVATLHLAAVWLIVANLGKPRAVATLAMGLLCTAMYFYHQNMIVAVIVLAPLYIAAIGRNRKLHTVLLLVTIALATAAILLSFPEKLGAYALRLPVISPWLEKIGLLAPNFVLIDRGTTGPITMGAAFARFSPADLLDTFLLPYSGTILLALGLLALAGRSLRVLWIAPFYFLWLAAAHYFGASGICGRCMLSYTPYFIGVGALAAALTLAMFATRMRAYGIPAGPPVMIGAVIAVGLNTFAPAFALKDDARNFPIPVLAQTQVSEWAETDVLARWIASNTLVHEPLLALHSLGQQKLPTLPYAVFLAGHPMPAQSIDPAASRRSLNAKLSVPAREAVQAAIEEESLWTDDTLARWLERDYDWVLFAEDKTADQKAMRAALDAHFDVAAATTFRGAAVSLYKRKPAQ